MFTLRVCSGLAQSGTFPCAYALLSTWTTKEEKSQGIGIIRSVGESGGAMMGLLISEVLLSLTIRLPGGAYVPGLYSVFWLWSVLGLAWVVVWLVLVPERDVPGAKPGSGEAPASPPWRQFLTRPEALALYANHTAVSGGHWLFARYRTDHNIYPHTPRARACSTRSLPSCRCSSKTAST